jgi:hypothetical protein
MTDPVDTNDAVWSRAFDWLRAVELDGHDLESALVSGVGLRERVKTLAVLFDLLPRSEIGRLSDVVTAWNQQFGEQSNVPLVELRRVARDVVAVRDNKHQEGDLWQRAAKLSRWRPDVVPLAKLPVSSSEVTDTDRKCCTEGIAAWLRELQENPQRRSIPGVIPGEADRPMSDVYVELLAVEDGDVVSTDESNSVARIRGRQNRAAEHSPPITTEAMISRTVERCVVIGDPGSGKSTLVRWLVWAAFEGRLADFDLAIEVKLSAYAAALVADENLTPLEYFFRSQGLNASDASKAAHGLSQTARESQRWLLLFDGWDEVPVAQRVIVKAQLRHVEPAFVTLITSRPSGMPRLLLERQHVACYRIAGLTPLLAQ